MMRTQSFVLAAVLGGSFALASSAHARECEGYTIPDRTEVGTTTLALSGMGIREATMLHVDVYVAGLYLQRPSRDAREILESEQIKHLELYLVRDVSRQEMLEALQEGFERNAGEALPELRDRMRRLGAWIPELREGDRVSFSYVPARGLQVRINGKLAGTIEGSDFARAFYSIWLGSNPPDKDLRRGLLGGECG